MLAHTMDCNTYQGARAMFATKHRLASSFVFWQFLRDAMEAHTPVTKLSFLCFAGAIFFGLHRRPSKGPAIATAASEASEAAHAAPPPPSSVPLPV